MIIGTYSEVASTFRRLISPDLQVIDPPQIDFVQAHSNVRTGLVRVNLDLQMLPLTWPTFASDKDVGNRQAVEIEAFALATARAYRPSIDSDPILALMLRRNAHPLTGLSPMSAFHTVSGLAVLCGTPPAADWRGCRASDDSPTLELIRHPILFIGNDDKESADYFQTVAGAAPGVILQANYTLSLLDGHFYAPVSWLTQVFFTGLFVAGLELVLRKVRLTPESAALVFLASTLIADGVILAALIERREYLVMWIPVLPFIVVRYGLENRKSREP